MKPEMKPFYTSTQWKRCRAEVLKQHKYMCDRCGANDKTLIVHHTIYLNEDNMNDPAISLNPELLEVLCIDCHNTEHMTKEYMAKRYKVAPNGEIIGIGD